MNEFLNEILEMPYSSLVPKILTNALRLEIFDELVEPLTSEELAAKRNWNENNTEIFLQALFSLDYLIKDGEKYKNSKNVNTYLVKNSPDYNGILLKFYGTDLGGIFPDDFTDLLEKGPLSPEELAKENNEINMDFAKMEEFMRTSQMSYSFTQIKNIMNRFDEYKRAKKILDLGCGVGMVGLGLIQDDSDKRITLFDLPGMEEPIKRSIELSKLEDRAEIILGDFTQDDIGSNYDVILSSFSIYAAKYCLDDFMNKIYNALNPGGIFVCITDGVEKDHSGPSDTVLSWLVYRMKGMDMEITKDMIKDSGLKAGFTSILKETHKISGFSVDIDVLKK